MPIPVQTKSIPAQVVNAQAAFGPFRLNDFFQSEAISALRFRAEVNNGQALPKGLICTRDGLLTGIPGKETQGQYEFIITVENDEGMAQATMTFTIKPGISTRDISYFDRLKSQVWEALEKNLSLPDLKEIHDRPIDVLDIYYLLERWATLKIWDGLNLDSAGDAHLIILEGASEHYRTYDRGSCLVGVPKDLFSHEHTLEDGLQTARAMAREAYKRGWWVELVGFDKLTRAAWVELQYLSELHDNPINILNFHPTMEDIKLYYAKVNGQDTPRPEI
ncbi:MAG TPA: Ig domain-containing protein [Gammaproteobacteria bacterium]|nr:Ig domain-containing protein [Gammaproteobacteria bacterium]